MAAEITGITGIVLAWLALSAIGVLLVLLLLWRYDVAAYQARRRGRALLAYLQRS